MKHLPVDGNKMSTYPVGTIWAYNHKYSFIVVDVDENGGLIWGVIATETRSLPQRLTYKELCEMIDNIKLNEHMEQCDNEKD